MKSHFSPQWKSSTQVRKQRKFRANAPLHTKHTFLSAHLSKPLQQKYGKRNLPLRKGDEVLVMRGSFRKKTAKIAAVNLKRSKVFLEGIQRAKRDGTKVNVPFSPHILQIQNLILDDKERTNAVQRKGATNASNKAGSNN